MKKYPQVLINVRIDRKVDIDEIDSVRAEVANVERALGNKGRVLLRASGTEPLVRVMVEGIDQDEVTKSARQLADAVRNAIVS